MLSSSEIVKDTNDLITLKTFLLHVEETTISFVFNFSNSAINISSLGGRLVK